MVMLRKERNWGSLKSSALLKGRRGKNLSLKWASYDATH